MRNVSRQGRQKSIEQWGIILHDKRPWVLYRPDSNKTNGSFCYFSDSLGCCFCIKPITANPCHHTATLAKYYNMAYLNVYAHNILVLACDCTIYNLKDCSLLYWWLILLPLNKKCVQTRSQKNQLERLKWYNLLQVIVSWV